MMFEHLRLLSADMSTHREMNALRWVNAKEMAAYHIPQRRAHGGRQAGTPLPAPRIINAQAFVIDGLDKLIHMSTTNRSGGENGACGSTGQ
jgi:hypothetical protein